MKRIDLLNAIGEPVEYFPLGITVLASYLKKQSDMECRLFDLNKRYREYALRKGLESDEYYGYQKGVSFGLDSCSSLRELLLRSDPGRRENAALRCFASEHIRSWGVSSIVGFSIRNFPQLLSSLVISRIIRKHSKHVRIVLGGPLLSTYRDEGARLSGLFDHVDAVIYSEGEVPLVEFARHASRKGSWKGLPNLVYRDRSGVCMSRGQYEKALCDIVNPDLEQIGVEGYDKIYFVPVARKCYNRCAFCAYNNHLIGRWRHHSAESILKLMEEAYDKYGSQEFLLATSSARPAILMGLAELIAERGRPFRWGTPSTIDDLFARKRNTDALYRGGCRLLMFGVESGSKRVLQLMHKRHDPADVMPVYRSCYESNILTSASFVMGFPGEEAADVRMTADLLYKLARYAFVIHFGTFILERNSPAWRQPEAYGIAIDDEAMKNDVMFCVRWNRSQDWKGYHDDILMKRLAKLSKRYYGVDLSGRNIVWEEGDRTLGELLRCGTEIILKRKRRLGELEEAKSRRRGKV